MSLSSNPNSYAGDRKDKGQSGDASLNTLLNANNLDSYVLPSALSVTVARSHKKSYPVQNEYEVGGLATTSSTVSFVLTPGADYVYGPDSYFTMNFESTEQTALCAGWLGEHGSILNIFKSVRLTHASGTEIEYIDNLNLLNVFKLAYDRDRTFRNTDGSGFGAAFDNDIGFSSNRSATTPLGALVPTDAAGTYRGDVHLTGSATEAKQSFGNKLFTTFQTDGTAQHTFCIPLSMISEFFNSDKLLPPYVLAGMRIELELESPFISTQSLLIADGVGTAPPSTLTHTINGLTMQLDSHTLTDSVAKALSRMSANEGLDIHFPSYFHDRHAIQTSNSTINITKALSRVEDICLIPRLDANIAATPAGGALESLQAARYPEDMTWQISIGSMFFPSHPVATPHDAFRLALQGRRHMCNVSFRKFAAEGLGAMRGALERSQILNGSGIAVSATRGATVAVNIPTNPLNYTMDLFVRHTKLVSVFLDNVVVRT